jgi:LuxR family transcriptional regulator, quorum-sensing system regulator SdiA
MATPDPKIDVVSQALKALGALCDRGFALAVHIRLIRPTLLYQTYAQDWVEHYSMKGYMLTDPTVLWGLEHTGGVRWSDLAAKDPAGVIRDAQTFGLTNGCTYATGPASSRTIASAAKSGADFTEAERTRIEQLVDAIHAATDGFDTFPSATLQALRDLGHRG